MTEVPYFTPAQQLANIELAARLWRERVAPESVVSGLEVWRCGSQACFGGHLATWPEFRRMGVKTLAEADPERCNEVRSGSVSLEFATALTPALWGFMVADVLFGDGMLFEPRGGHPADPNYPNVIDDDDTSITDHQLVLNRLEYSSQCSQESS